MMKFNLCNLIPILNELIVREFSITTLSHFVSDIFDYKHHCSDTFTGRRWVQIADFNLSKCTQKVYHESDIKIVRCNRRN